MLIERLDWVTLLPQMELRRFLKQTVESPLILQ